MCKALADEAAQWPDLDLFCLQPFSPVLSIGTDHSLCIILVNCGVQDIVQSRPCFTAADDLGLFCERDLAVRNYAGDHECMGMVAVSTEDPLNDQG